MSCPVTGAAYRAGRADGPSRCTWHPGMTDAERAADPHTHTPPAPRRKILGSVLEAIGNTPLIRINHGEPSLACFVLPLWCSHTSTILSLHTVSEGLTCEVVAKCEFFSAGGSVKDR